MSKRTLRKLEDYADFVESPVSSAQTYALLREFTDLLSADLSALKSNERILIAGLGVFTVKQRKGREAILNADGDVCLPAVGNTTYVHFRSNAGIRRTRKS